MAKKQDWSREEQAVQAVQMAFDLSNDIQRAFRVSAAMQDMTTADMVRKVLHLRFVPIGRTDSTPQEGAIRGYPISHPGPG